RHKVELDVAGVELNGPADSRFGRDEDQPRRDRTDQASARHNATPSASVLSDPVALSWTPEGSADPAAFGRDCEANGFPTIEGLASAASGLPFLGEIGSGSKPGPGLSPERMMA